MPTDDSSCCFDPEVLVVGDFGSAAAADAVDIMVVSPSPLGVGEVGAAAVEAADLRGGIAEWDVGCVIDLTVAYAGICLTITLMDQI
jgi:hypothetical protein